LLHLAIGLQRGATIGVRRDTKPRMREMAMEGSPLAVRERKLQRELSDVVLHQLLSNSIFAFTDKVEVRGIA
jgi:hypothetical protein